MKQAQIALEAALTASGSYKGLTAEIYNWSLGNCSNNGISANHTKVFIICPEGHLSSDEVTDMPIVQMVQKHGDYKTAVECNANGVIKDGWSMAGGSFVYSCDSRFRQNLSEYPIPLHDRYEG